MLALRRDVSFLLEKGHSQARLYPIIMLWNEAEICRERKRADFITLLTIMQTVGIATNGNHTKSSAKKSADNLNMLIKEIQNGGYV